MGKKKSIFNSSLVAFLVFLVIFLFNTLMEPKTSGVTINFLDVGQGDASLITNSHNQAILIDGGPSSYVIDELSTTLPFYQRKITTIILTHPHADHLSGLLEVIKKYEVNNIYSTGIIHTTPEYLEFLELIKEKNIAFKTLKAGDKLTYEDGLELKVHYPLKDMAGEKIDNLNNSSVVVRATYGQIDTMFMGDLEQEAQEEILSSNSFEIDSEIIKVPHHGSKDSVNQRFIEKVTPEVAVFTVGKDNKFNHPSAIALKAYQASKIFRTDEDGTIRINISKENIENITTD